MKNTNVKKAVLPQILIFAAAVILTLAAWGLGKLQTPESLVAYSYEDRNLPEDMLSIIHAFCQYVDIELEAEPSAIRDPKDLYLLSLAETIGADYIVSGDADLTDLKLADFKSLMQYA